MLKASSSEAKGFSKTTGSSLVLRQGDHLEPVDRQ